MTDDATLSDFAAVGEEERDGDDADESPATAADAAISTYAWGEYACDRCDGPTEQVWRNDGDFVCPTCKEW
ncbi:hypothetical protein [Natrinema sp. 74]|uniref:DUF7573 domain-containing protein n=1 Tax=Natrinema sp. 74 TaxID=3384159 RepID=UPI0038D3834E